MMMMMSMRLLCRRMSLRQTCGSVHECSDGEEVEVHGWLLHSRSMGNKLHFVGLRDAYGRVECVCSADETRGLDSIRGANLESVVSMRGIVRPKLEQKKGAEQEKKWSKNMREIHVSEATLLNACEPLPTPLCFDESASSKAPPRTETQRLALLRHRYLALREPTLQRNLRARARVCHAVRRELAERHRFVEVETPTLFRATAEGAREFVVPTRRRAGHFYALPQSPQQYKQLLMVGGLDRYFQLARCYRDEDSRSDRQPEFTQIDLEMSFASADDVRAVTERLLGAVWRALELDSLPERFEHMRYADAMERYGCDKPDRRFALELHDVSGAAPSPGAWPSPHVKAIVLRGGGADGRQLSRREANALVDSVAQRHGDVRMLSFGVDDARQWRWPAYRALSDADRRALDARMPLEPADVLFACHGADRSRVNAALGELRLALGDALSLRRADHFEPLWIVDFPLFERADDASLSHRRFGSTHHPFTSPVADDVERLRSWDGVDDEALLAVHGDHYDCVLNGVELGGGSVRIHDAALQRRVFSDVLSMRADEIDEQFQHLLGALSFGAPPHAGIALGLDRLMAIVCGADSLHDVVAFPKTATAHELMTRSPGLVADEHLAQYHIRVQQEQEQD
jgi:aspartyl-tRNA synthetase